MRELVVVGIPLRIKRSEEENMVLSSRNVAAQLGIRVIVALMENLALQIEARIRSAAAKIVGELARQLRALRSEVTTQGTMECAAA